MCSEASVVRLVLQAHLAEHQQRSWSQATETKSVAGTEEVCTPLFGSMGRVGCCEARHLRICSVCMRAYEDARDEGKHEH